MGTYLDKIYPPESRARIQGGELATVGGVRCVIIDDIPCRVFRSDFEELPDGELVLVNLYHGELGWMLPYPERDKAWRVRWLASLTDEQRAVRDEARRKRWAASPDG